MLLLYALISGFLYRSVCSKPAYPTNNPSSDNTEQQILQRKSAELLSQLNYYEMSIPVQVDNAGNFLSYDVRKTSRTKRDVAIIHSDRVFYKLSAFGKEFHFELRLNTLLVSGNFVIESFGRNGTVDTTKEASKCHYTGRSREPHVAKAAISNCVGLHGVFSTDEDDYFVEPLWNHTNDIEQDGHPHVVYRRSALRLPETHTHCGVRDHGHTKSDWLIHKSQWIPSRSIKPKKHKNVRHWRNRRKKKNRHNDNKLKRKRKQRKRKSRRRKHNKKRSRGKRSTSQRRNVEMLVVVDMTMINYHGFEEIVSYVLTIMNIVAKLYQDPSIGNSINIVVTRLVRISDEQPNLKINHHADRSLDSFCKWQRSINTPENEAVTPGGIAHHDNAVLITRYDICTYKNKPCGTLGLAPVSGMCEAERSCSINEDIGLASAFTIAHEVGHNFGMQHDGAGNLCGTPGEEPARIMAAQLTKDTVPFLWSSCSRVYITNFLDSGKGRCLDNIPPKKEVFPQELPGIRHNANKQCKLQFGDLSQNCKPKDVCRELWCYNRNNECVTNSIPASEGTPCPRNKKPDGWCYRGECKKPDFFPHPVNGSWGQWSGWGECSRTCGGGVKSSIRECDNPLPENGGQYCLGERKRYRSCSIEPCPKNSVDFRETQCAQYDKVQFRGRQYTWKPFSGAHVQPCALNCIAEGYNFYTERASKVIDGTRCYPDKLDMCINGDCHHVGCDGVLSSAVTEDKCRVCGGNGSTCQKVSGVFRQSLPKGAYQEVVKIPKGAVHIMVEESTESKNYLALKSEAGSFYINGDWTIDWPRKFPVAGTIFHYERSTRTPEVMKAVGPTEENLVVMILLQEDNLGIHYEYNMPANASGGNHDISRYTWQHSPWSECSHSCGRGKSMATAVCVLKTNRGVVDDQYCSPQPKPSEHVRGCNDDPCPSEWSVGEWSECSHTCGGGKKRRNVVCRQQINQEEQVILDDDECPTPKPNSSNRCQVENCPATWIAEDWSECSKECGRGHKTRHVYCMTSDRKKYLADTYCDVAERPSMSRRCIQRNCPPPKWLPGEWGRCSAECGHGQQRREVRCVYQNQPSNACMHTKPITERDCESRCEEETAEEECVDQYTVAYCPLVLKYKLCEREYFQKLCCRTCLANYRPRRRGR